MQYFENFWGANAPPLVASLSPGKMRMLCDMTRHQSNRHCKVRSLIHTVKCDCSVQRLGRMQTI